MSSPHNFDGRMTSSLAFYSDFASGPAANLQWVAQQAVPVMRSADTLKIAPLGAFASILVLRRFSTIHQCTWSDALI
ncbi:hypothetical protein NXX53_23625 [Bacteroides salyersiae]|nr:hypothetical protein [Bacteroides salyersiae]